MGSTMLSFIVLYPRITSFSEMFRPRLGMNAKPRWAPIDLYSLKKWSLSSANS